MGSTKSVLPSYKIISAGDMSGDITSPVLDVTYVNLIAVQFNFTGTPTGVFSVLVSADAGLTYVTLDGLSNTPVASGTDGTVGCNITNLGFNKMKLKYSRTSGTGSLDAYVSTKGL